MQTASLQKYAALGMTQWKAAATVDDPDSLWAYVAGQGTRTTKVVNQLLSDTPRAYPLAADFLSEVQQIAQGNMTPVTELARGQSPAQKVAA